MKVVSRKQWGARPPKQRTLLAVSAVDALVVHYSASNADEQALHENCAGRVRAIQTYHMDGQDWSDIAYNWLVCKHGSIFRGRGWPVMPAATYGHNRHTVAICFLGNDTKGRADVTKEAERAIREVYAFVKARTPQDIGATGHRDFVATSCPGDELYAFVESLDRERLSS